MRVLIIIPAYNEAENIERVVNNLKTNFAQYDYVVINDGSTDNTAEICKKNNFNLVNLSVNLGIGGCVQTGFLYALKHNYDVAVQMDGDGQHLPEEVEKLLQPIKDNKADFVIGSRFILKEGFQSSFLRQCGIRFLSFIIRISSGAKVLDTTSGFRAINKRALELLAVDYAPDYPEPESTVNVILHGMHVEEVPVLMKEREGGVSSISFFKSVYYMIKVTLALIFKKLMVMREMRCR